MSPQQQREILGIQSLHIILMYFQPLIKLLIKLLLSLVYAVPKYCLSEFDRVHQFTFRMCFLYFLLWQSNFISLSILDIF